MVGLEIMELPSGRILFSHNGNKRFVPASAAKIFTTACALSTLGQDFRYVTQFVATGPIKKDKLAGDLVLYPSQDPTLTNQDIVNMLSLLKAKNIRHIEGTLRLQSAPNSLEHFFPGWLAEDWGQDWMPVPSNLVIDRNLAPTADPASGSSTTTRLADKTNNALLSTLLLSNMTPGWVSFDTASRSIIVCRNPQPSMSTNGSLVVANPDDYNLALVATLAHSLGLHFGSRLPAKSLSQESLVVLADKHSKPLKDIIKITLKESDNLYAQQLLRSLGLKAPSSARQNLHTLEERGISCLSDWLTQIGVSRGEIVLYDGCGLSRKNCVTPHALNMVLKHMAGSDLKGSYLDLLTCQNYGESRQFSFCFKTGAMDSVRSVSGVMRTGSNKAIAISILVNGHTPSVANLRVDIANLVQTLENLALSGLPCPDLRASHGTAVGQKSNVKANRRRSKRVRRNLS